MSFFAKNRNGRSSGRLLFLLSVLIWVFWAPHANGEEESPAPVCWWSLDKAADGRVLDAAAGIEDEIRGHFKSVQGVVGNSLRLDGFTSVIIRDAGSAPVLSEGFTMEAWVAPATYPWNWCPILCQEEDEQEGYYFAVGPQGHLGLQVAIDGLWKVCVSEDKIPLRQWSHLAATFDSKQGITLYINGRPSGRFPQHTGRLSMAADKSLRIGMNRVKKIPSHPVRTYATLPAWFSFDGICDEIKIFDRALTSEQIQTAVVGVEPPAAPDIPLRAMPSGPKGPGTFGAYYTHLEYYEEWDALWRVGPDADVVVQFDDSPIRVVFWRGTRYSPAWVMENGQWMADQSAEYFNTTDGCFEHMLDPRCLSSHVRIIENTPARVVVHWRYIPVSVRRQYSQVDEITDWSDAIDEYYTFFPDGLGVRHVIQRTSGKPLGPQEAIVLCQPGTTPEDNTHLDALTLVNLAGESHLYSWAGETPDFGKEARPDNPVIQYINLKSRAKPYLIFEPGCRMRVFAIEQRKDVSHFPWWNHWPVAQIPSDGRYCQAPDRASHFSLSWGGPPVHKGNDSTYWSCWIYGTTQGRPEELAVLAKSWAQAPKLTVVSGEAEALDYDRTRRAYVLDCGESAGQRGLELKLAAGPDFPMVNGSFVLRNWNGPEPSVELDGRKLKRGVDYRIGEVRRLDGRNLVLWIEQTTNSPVRISLKPGAFGP